MTPKPRHQIIDFSVQLEYNLSMFLCGWLNIDREQSRSLSTKSSRLSFNQQLNLVLDMKILDKSEIQKLECFAQIRNKFAHTAEITTYHQCLTSNNSLRNTINKLYHINTPIEDELDSLSQINDLLYDIKLIGDKLIDKLKMKLQSN